MGWGWGGVVVFFFFFGGGGAGRGDVSLKSVENWRGGLCSIWLTVHVMKNEISLSYLLAAFIYLKTKLCCSYVKHQTKTLILKSAKTKYQTPNTKQKH